MGASGLGFGCGLQFFTVEHRQHLSVVLNLLLIKSYSQAFMFYSVLNVGGNFTVRWAEEEVWGALGLRIV